MGDRDGASRAFSPRRQPLNRRKKMARFAGEIQARTAHQPPRPGSVARLCTSKLVPILPPTAEPPPKPADLPPHHSNHRAERPARSHRARRSGTPEATRLDKAPSKPPHPQTFRQTRTHPAQPADLPANRRTRGPGRSHQPPPMSPPGRLPAAAHCQAPHQHGGAFQAGGWP